MSEEAAGEVLERAQALSKEVDEKLLRQEAVMTLLEGDRAQASKDRRLMKRIILLLVALVLVLGSLITIGVENLYKNGKIAANTNKTAQRIIDCTTAGHACYDQQQDQARQQAEDAITQVLNSLHSQSSQQLSDAEKTLEQDLQALLMAINAGKTIIVFPPATTPPTSTTPTTPTTVGVTPPSTLTPAVTVPQVTTTTTPPKGKKHKTCILVVCIS